MEESIKMKHFDHPNVLHLIGVCLDAGPAPYVVMPYMANGSLLHYLKKERNNIVLPVGVDDDVVSDSIISDCDAIRFPTHATWVIGYTCKCRGSKTSVIL